MKHSCLSILSFSLIFFVSFNVSAKKKRPLEIVGSKKLASLLCAIFIKPNDIEGDLLEKRISCLNQHIEKVQKKILSKGEDVILSKVSSFLAYLTKIQKYQKRGKYSAQAGKINAQELEAIETLCNNHKIYLHWRNQPHAY